MKKINFTIFLFLILFLLNIIIVNALDVDINLIEYDAVSGSSLISISNIGENDLHNVGMIIGDSDIMPVAQLLSSGRTVYSDIGMDPGEYDITIIADEGSETRTLLFAQSKESLKTEKEEIKKAKEEAVEREEELARVAEENKRQAELEIQQERENAIVIGAIEEKSNLTLIWIIIGVLLVIGIILWLIKRQK